MPSGSFFGLTFSVRGGGGVKISELIFVVKLALNFRQELKNYQYLKSKKRQNLVVLTLTRENSRSSSMPLLGCFMRPIFLTFQKQITCN